MSFTSDHRTKEYSRIKTRDASGGEGEGEGKESPIFFAKQRQVLAEWLNSIIPNLNLPITVSNEELRTSLSDGVILCQILNMIKPGYAPEIGKHNYPSTSHEENVKRFLAATNELGIPKFDISDLEKGSMRPVVDCLLTLRAQVMPNMDEFPPISNSSPTKSGSFSPHSPRSYLSVAVTGDEKRRALKEPKAPHALHSSPIATDSSSTINHRAGTKMYEAFQAKQGNYVDIPSSKYSHRSKSNGLDNAPTQSLLTIVNGILDETIERKNGEFFHRMICILRKIIQEIERRISTQAEHLRMQNNLFKTREEKYQSRIKVLEYLATGTSDETEIVTNHLQQIKTAKTKIEEMMRSEEGEMFKLIKEKDQIKREIFALKHELETTKGKFKLRSSQVETQAKDSQTEIDGRMKELTETKIAKEVLHKQAMELKHSNGDNGELEKQMMGVTQAGSANNMLEERVKELESLLADSRREVKSLEASSLSRSENWSKIAQSYKHSMDNQLRELQEMRSSSDSLKQVILSARESYYKEIEKFGSKLKMVTDTVENYHAVLTENRKLFNEIQDLKGNIRVFCRVRPFLPGQNKKQTTVEYVGDNGELVLANPSKLGKEGHRMFKFNQVFGPTASQVDVYSQTQPLIRSVLDGYNVCIFAYGQTGSGKTYTMTGPSGASEEEWGVNYRALNDLFGISQKRRSTHTYEVGIQMVEIYNEHVRDLLTSDASRKNLGILTGSQPNGLAVPDASMLPVKTTSDVLELINIGLKNRAVSSTAMNERSSRSHSIVTIHVRGTDLKTSSTLTGSLHLVDLAGSERVDRSEVTGDRLREAQHINKSLSALGDVIFALSQKNSHVPYRNSKLTQVLQSSLGGQAKTLMLVQLNPDAVSYSETLSTLKFAERVSGVELGAARSSKEGRDVRELMEQVTTLKEIIAKKDEEMNQFLMQKDLKNSPSSVKPSKPKTDSVRHNASSPNRGSIKGSSQGLADYEKAIHESDSPVSSDDLKNLKEFAGKKKLSAGDIGNETDGSCESSPPRRKTTASGSERARPARRVSRTPQRLGHSSSTTALLSKDTKIAASQSKDTAKPAVMKKAANSPSISRANKLRSWH